MEEQVGNGMMVPHAMMPMSAMPASMMAMPTISSRRGIKGGANTMSEYFMQLNERNAQLQNNAHATEMVQQDVVGDEGEESSSDEYDSDVEIPVQDREYTEPEALAMEIFGAT